MKLLRALITTSFLFLTEAIRLVPRDTPRVARLDIHRYDSQGSLAHESKRKRQKWIEQPLDNSKTYYYADVSLGTPSQGFRLLIDTGYSDTWVNTANATVCSRENKCGNSGTYNANRSSTYKYMSGGFNVSYSADLYAQGDYATDTLSIGGQTVKNMSFGIGYTSSTEDGALGLGYSKPSYPNLPRKLVDDGSINSNAYSLWLNDLGATTGSILFGGVDTAKYTGGLRSVPIVSINGSYTYPQISLTAVGQNGTYTSTGVSGIPVSIESFNTLSYLPSNITTKLYQQFNASYNSRDGVAMINCSLASQPGTIDFSFSGVNISVPLRTLVIEVGTAGGQPVCGFGISTTANVNETAALGVSFLRAAYVVFDLDNNRISLAQTRFNVTEEKIVEIAKGPGGVPTSVFNTPTSSPTSRGGGATSTFTTSSTGDDGGDSSKGLSTGAKAGIGVGVVAGVALIAGAALLLIKRRKNTYAQPEASKPPVAKNGGNLPEYMGRA